MVTAGTPTESATQRVFLDRPDISTCTCVRTMLEGAVIEMRVVPQVQEYVRP